MNDHYISKRNIIMRRRRDGRSNVLLSFALVFLIWFLACLRSIICNSLILNVCFRNEASNRLNCYQLFVNLNRRFLPPCLLLLNHTQCRLSRFARVLFMNPDELRCDNNNNYSLGYHLCNKVNLLVCRQVQKVFFKRFVSFLEFGIRNSRL